MSPNKVMVDDNFHYQNKDERYELGGFFFESFVRCPLVAPKAKSLACPHKKFHQPLTNSRMRLDQRED